MVTYHPVRERMTVGDFEELWGVEAQDARGERPKPYIWEVSPTLGGEHGFDV